MNLNRKNYIIQFNNLAKIHGLVHGFSTRYFGSMRPNDLSSNKSLELFSKEMEINPDHIVKMHQTHSSNIRWVTQKEKGLRIDDVDGLLTKEKNVYISVITADCIPVLMFDKHNGYSGITHAGWKGVHNGILKAAVNQLVSGGSNPADILVGIGPCIRSCCYNIRKDRADLFGKEYVYQRNGLDYLDLAKIAKNQLLSVGILKENIEDCGICTFDNKDTLFSFRREGERFGEFMGIIGIKH